MQQAKIVKSLVSLINQFGLEILHITCWKRVEEFLKILQERKMCSKKFIPLSKLFFKYKDNRKTFWNMQGLRYYNTNECFVELKWYSNQPANQQASKQTDSLFATKTHPTKVD